MNNNPFFSTLTFPSLVPLFNFFSLYFFIVSPSPWAREKFIWSISDEICRSFSKNWEYSIFRVFFSPKDCFSKDSHFQKSRFLFKLFEKFEKKLFLVHLVEVLWLLFFGLSSIFLFSMPFLFYFSLSVSIADRCFFFYAFNSLQSHSRTRSRDSETYKTKQFTKITLDNHLNGTYLITFRLSGRIW